MTHPVQDTRDRLMAAGAELQKTGVDFLDLTDIYRDSPQTLYQDDCCHPNREGYEMVARRIAERLADQWDRSAESQ